MEVLFIGIVEDMPWEKGHLFGDVSLHIISEVIFIFIIFKQKWWKGEELINIFDNVCKVTFKS
jgi:hypothetical protein